MAGRRDAPVSAAAASGAVELPFSHRAAIALQFGTEDALRKAEVALRTRHADAFGWSATQWPAVLAELQWLHAVARWDSRSLRGRAQRRLARD